MIVVRAPFRIGFVGGGTDLPDFYRRRPGRVLSTTIDKYMYVVRNRTPMISKVSARYNLAETVDHPRELKHTRIRAALLDLGIESGIEIASFAALPAKTGLGSSSSFSVALMKALHAYKGESLDPRAAAEAASRLEIELIGEPIGKQDQYAASFGGLNVFQFNPDDSVDVEPVLLGWDKRLRFEDHLLLFFTGITRPVSMALDEQKANIGRKFDTLCEMADSVPSFGERLEAGDYEALGKLLHSGWLRKKSLASKVSNSVIDDLYDAGVLNGAWGGKILGAGGGGCILFVAPPEKQPGVRDAVGDAAQRNGLEGFLEIPVKFTQSGTQVLFNGDHHDHGVPMREYIENFVGKAEVALRSLPVDEMAKALNILQAVYERDGRIYAFGNGGSLALALATHWVSDFNKTVFSNNLELHRRRFQAIRLPTTEEELTAWASDVGYDMVFAGPLQNYLQDADAVVAISSSGNSTNVLKAVELAKSRNVPVVGISGFDSDNQLNRLSDAKVHVPTERGDYEVVEGIHSVVLHVMTRYFKDYFDHLVAREAKRTARVAPVL